MSGFLSLFWVTRIVVHVAYYDPELRRAHRLLDAAFLSAVVYLAIVFGVARAVRPCEGRWPHGPS